MKKFKQEYAYYIKLGRGGSWEKDCIKKGTLRLGYTETPHELCMAGRWEEVREIWLKIRKDDGAATSDTNQIRTFYEADESVIWITFIEGQMYWCNSKPGVKKSSGGKFRYRKTVDGWHSKSMGGNPLSAEKLSGNLLKVQAFRGTICKVGDADYLLRKIKDETLPEVMEAEKAEENLRQAVLKLMRRLTWQDFELLVDLVFANSGWQRVGVVGKTQKTVDLDLRLPTTGERAFVQVKSKAGNSELKDYAERFDGTESYARMFFVWHTGQLNENAPDGITLVGPNTLSRWVLDSGLVSWLKDKVS